MMRRLEAVIPDALLDKFQIFFSRVHAPLDPERIKILYAHDLPEDPESAHLANQGWNRFDYIVFVTYWQRQRYMDYYKIDQSRTLVMRNAIVPIKDINKPDISHNTRIIYHTTPHRGLGLLVPVFRSILSQFSTAHLDVYSSFEVYGWGERDKEYQELFEQIKAHPNMTYHGAQPNDVVRTAVSQAHVFAYPSIWPETSCLSLIEAMSAKCLCVHSDLGALPETASNYTAMYGYDSDPNVHANKFRGALINALELVKTPEALDTHLSAAKSYIDLFYNWPDVRAKQWISFLEYAVNSPRRASGAGVFTYRTT